MVHGSSGRARARVEGTQPHLSGWTGTATGADTIVAIATPPGAGALGIVRLSGPDAVVIAGAVLAKPSVLESQRSHTVRYVELVDRRGAEPLDGALCTVMRGPRSYTGEDVVEFSCHGSLPLLAMVVQSLQRAGARLAAPGEFSRRAFVNGRLSLARAEAVAFVIGARTERAVRLAARARLGEVGDRIAALREALLDLVSGLEVCLDFPDEQVGLDVVAADARLQQLVGDVEVLQAAATRGRLVHDGVTIAIVGRPNAGKSSLLNALLGREQAIVASTPGTTRDVVEGAFVIAGVPVRLLDTAGFGDAADAIEAEGMARSRRALEECDIALVVVDGSAPPAEGSIDFAGRRRIIVRSKSDLAQHGAVVEMAGAVAVSSLTGAGLGELLRRLEGEVTDAAGAENDEGQVVASLRQMDGVERIHSALKAAVMALSSMPLEVALVDLRQALVATSEILGMEVGDAVLDRIFSTFCVGK